MGFLNGVAVFIILGQADKIFGFAVVESGILPRLVEIFGGKSARATGRPSPLLPEHFLSWRLRLAYCRGYPQLLLE